MELSVRGLIGAFAGLVVALINDRVLVGVFQRRLRALDQPNTRAQHDALVARLGILRRVVLGVDIVLFSAVGYWLGRTFGG
jgi:hypothetical protein